MQTLDVTEEQHAFIQHLRTAIAENVVGEYGFVREQDAVQFLIDNLDDDFEIDAEIQSTAAADVADAVSAAVDDERSEREEMSYDETGSVGSHDDGTAESDSSADSATDTDEVDEPATEPDDANDANNADTTSNADDDEMLDEMMSLLETHDDKWTESSASDYRYSVTLPDGSTTEVQTKDDVRALLFKNYR